MAMKFSPSAGYRRLDSWVLASVVQLGTYRFCKKYLMREFDPTGRQYDQMTQAARSGKVNIVEGSARSATSKETEMKLTDVARASLAELHSDYEDWILLHGQAPWAKSSTEAQAVYETRLDKPDYGADFVRDSCLHLLEQQQKFSRWLDSEDSLIVANAMLILIGRVINMLLRQLEAQGGQFAETGGFREQLTTIRTNAIVEKEAGPVCPMCGKSMRRRSARTGAKAGKPFWGCTGYPDCTGTREIAP